MCTAGDGSRPHRSPRAAARAALSGHVRPQAPLWVMLFDRTLIHRLHQEVRLWTDVFSNAVDPTPRSEPLCVWRHCDWAPTLRLHPVMMAHLSAWSRGVDRRQLESLLTRPGNVVVVRRGGWQTALD